MPAGHRSTRRPGSGPGRGSPRTHTSRPDKTRTGSLDAADEPAADQPEPSSAQSADESAHFWALARRRSGLTTRAIALGVVVLVLTISYASSLRVYLNQQHDLAETRQEIAQRQQRITSLESELSRWQDPAYVRAQARERLGWVVPGEIGYKVIGADGKPIGGGTEIDSTAAAKPDEPTPAWWDKLWGTVRVADHPAPGQEGGPAPKPSKDPTITVTTKPGSKPTQ